MEPIFVYYNLFNASLIISSRLAPGFSLSTADTALFTFALVKPSRTRAVVASSTAGFEPEEKSCVVSDPAPFTTLSLSSSISL